MEFKVQVTWQIAGDPDTWYREVRTVRAVSRKHALDKALRKLAEIPDLREAEAQMLTTWDLLNGGN